MSAQMLYGLPDSLSGWAVEFRRRYPIIAAGDAVMTLMEDVVAPHGGVVRQGCLVELMELLGFSAGSLRSAIARLNAEGKLKSIAIGRRADTLVNEEYGGCAHEAFYRVYASIPNGWTGKWEYLVLERGITEAAVYSRTRSCLVDEGFFVLSDQVFMRPEFIPEANTCLEKLFGDSDLMKQAKRIIGVAGGGNDETPVDWIRKTPDFVDLEARYETYVLLFNQLQAELQKTALPASAAFAARMLMIHQYRSLVRATPELPEELRAIVPILDVARTLTIDIYVMLAERSEEYLARELETSTGQKLRLGNSFYLRFGGLPMPE